MTGQSRRNCARQRPRSTICAGGSGYVRSAVVVIHGIRVVIPISMPLTVIEVTATVVLNSFFVTVRKGSEHVGG
jgi:hypothetical protein